MKVTYHKVDFPIEQILEQNLPWTREFYSSQAELNSDVRELFHFFTENKDNLPFYNLTETQGVHMQQVATASYAVMLEAVKHAFENPSLIHKYFGCKMLDSTAGDAFIEYAKWTFGQKNMRGQSLYSRFDMAVDPVTGKVKGIYELNVDTPTMLFESTTLQDELVRQITGEDNQFNNWFENIAETLKETLRSVYKGNKFGVVFDSNFIEDTTTCEIIADLLSEPTACMMVDIKHLAYEDLQPHKPWIAYEHSLDGMFILSPWEEMVVNFPKAWMHWETWCHNVVVMEPAWKWFMSNKGILALVSDLLEQGLIGHGVEAELLPFLHTSLSQTRFRGQKHIGKPKVGRMSNNIQLFGEEGQVLLETDGYYHGEARIFQEYCQAGSLRDGSNFIVSVWMEGGSPVDKLAKATNIAIREFDTHVTNVQNERFVPHVIVE